MNVPNDIKPRTNDDGIPLCDNRCKYFDGKRCEVLGHQPGTICEPGVAQLAGARRPHGVVQDWVFTLPLRGQGTLLTGVRGCDLAPKVPGGIDERYGCSTGEDSAERHLSAFLRYCCWNPADPREVDIPGSWFQSQPPAKWKPSQFGHYPLHWYEHLMHCFEVVGYCKPLLPLLAPGHPLQPTNQALGIYLRMVKNLHLEPESKERMLERLTEDRLAAGNVVS